MAQVTKTAKEITKPVSEVNENKEQEYDDDDESDDDFIGPPIPRSISMLIKYF